MFPICLLVFWGGFRIRAIIYTKENETMVRPVAQQGLFKKLVAENNRVIVAAARKSNIVMALRREIEQIVANSNRTEEPVRILDVGCGDMGISELLMQQMPDTEITCVDTYAPPAEESDNPRWRKYRQFDGKKLPFGDSEFDISMCVDVLHHAGIEGAETLLSEMLRTSRCVIVKDHFETGLITRTLLQLADFYGNWGYGVNIPKQYFRDESWMQAVRRAGLVELKRINSVQIHSDLLSVIFPPKLHFISVMTRREIGGCDSDHV